MIEISNVSKTFAAGTGQVEAVRDVSLSVEQGEICGIIGFSGAGKSTLVRCINLLERPESGSVRVDGAELTAMRPKELRMARKKIGMIFQHFNLMNSRTVFGNVAYPLRNSGLSRQEVRYKVKSLLKLVDIADKEDAYPNQISGGQKQRVAIARALANDPKALLCDEATSALDPHTTASILQLLKKLNRELGITLVVITHEMSVVKEICSRVAVMEAGRIVEEGSVLSVFSNPSQPITRQFISSSSNIRKIDGLIEEKSPVVALKSGEMIVRLSYSPSNVSEPLISTISRKFGIDINIIFSDVEIVQDSPLGCIVGILSGGRDKADAAIEYLREKKVRVEVILDANVF